MNCVPKYSVSSYFYHNATKQKNQACICIQSPSYKHATQELDTQQADLFPSPVFFHFVFKKMSPTSFSLLLVAVVVAGVNGNSAKEIQNEDKLAAAVRVKRGDDFFATQVEYDQLAQTVQHQEAEITQLRAQITKLQSDLGTARTQVGFFAYPRASRLNLASSGNVVFDYVRTNQGNAYDPHSGFFTAPVNGLYAFFVTIRSYSATGTEYVDITLNGSYRARAYVTAQVAQATAHVTLHLTKGNTVYLKNGSSSHYDIYGGIYSHFSGFLVQADP